MESKYTLEYFIEKLSAIPENKWCINSFHNADKQSCVLGHCGEGFNRRTEEGQALTKICHFIISVNDDIFKEYRHLGTTPKERVINYLKSLRDGK